MSTSTPNYYQILGLDRGCTDAQIKQAYRRLAKLHHPDVSSARDRDRIQALNAAHEILSDCNRRRRYDAELDAASRAMAPGRAASIERNIRQELRLKIEDFLRGTTVSVQVRDPANPDAAETYPLQVPAGTAPGARLRISRSAEAGRGYVELRLKLLPGYRFKARGSDLRCDLRISAQRAENGGTESVERPTGGFLRVTIPPRVKRGEIVRVAGEGLPRLRGGRGDLLVRITYRPEVRITHTR